MVSVGALQAGVSVTVNDKVGGVAGAPNIVRSSPVTCRMCAKGWAIWGESVRKLDLLHLCFFSLNFLFSYVLRHFLLCFPY